MNHLLYNISVLMIFTGLISLTYYLAKAYNKKECPKYNETEKEKEITIDETYTMRPSQIFDSMFIKPSIWQGYESIPVIKTRS
jgi:Na+/phosphate symporter